LLLEVQRQRGLVYSAHVEVLRKGLTSSWLSGERRELAYRAALRTAEVLDVAELHALPHDGRQTGDELLEQLARVALAAAKLRAERARDERTQVRQRDRLVGRGREHEAQPEARHLWQLRPRRVHRGRQRAQRTRQLHGRGQE